MKPTPPTILIIPDISTTLEDYYEHLMHNLNAKYLPPSPPSTRAHPDHWAGCHPEPPNQTASRTVTRRERIY